jgi:DNA-binding CsgD family transcriptional regulator
MYFLNRWQRNKYRLQKARHDEDQKKLQYLHQLEIDKAANELIKLGNEKLEAEVDFKNSELATSAMHLVQKGELLSKVKAELNRLIKVLDNENAINELKKMIKVLSEDDKMDKDWDHFAQHFDKVHRDFVVVLKEKHPTITGNELKLSAYLRMNLSTKEIAQLMNISVRGIEISRYRLRKKLGISSEVNLFDYLISLA